MENLQTFVYEYMGLDKSGFESLLRMMPPSIRIVVMPKLCVEATDSGATNSPKL